MATYVFFVLTGYKFRPVSQHPYFSVHSGDDFDDEDDHDDDGEVEMQVTISYRIILSIILIRLSFHFILITASHIPV